MAFSLLSVADLSSKEFVGLVDSAKRIKAAMVGGKRTMDLKGKVIGILFEKPSTRTRTSFQAATIRMGGNPIYLSAGELQLSRGEPVKDVARMLGGWLDIIVARVYSHDTLVQLAEYSKLPVINALSDIEHPTQMISDFLTIRESKGRIKGLKMAYIGDGNNMANSLLLSCALTGMDISIASPLGYEPSSEYIKKAKLLSASSGSKIEVVTKPTEAAKDADILYTDVWVSMGEEKEAAKRLKAFKGYQINSSLLKYAKSDAIVMHCLPAHRGLEITDDVLEGKQSVAWVQGVNKLYGAASVLGFIAKHK
ncbi:MAG: ornithine carbamoyltransferase [Candidatus Micrarchaeia archaeon]